ncbi:glycosyltransferase family 2 protein [Lutibacter sp. B1]|uniref:glycosyltransferase family 2 protein n=1 Tax=Lutibacter sp. B1 TaxID=2725996 RepID=UPI0014569F96|nr:glycosyltransferase family 2 protein [Lutibacter sp. B1]NLP58164.1 glycosyltransferase [Lutibacter sp. B1]
MKNPKVTIILATYNRAHLINETLQSIQNQSYKNWECIIVDDGGTDNTHEIIEPILKVDTRFQYLKRPNDYKKGLSGSRNFGLDKAIGDYIIFFDDDDIVHPQNLELSIYAIEEKKVDFCNYQKQPFIVIKPVVNEQRIKYSGYISKKELTNIVTETLGLASCTVMWRKECFQKIRFNENLKYAEEWECYSRIIAESYIGITLDNILYYNRKHPNSNTGKFYSGRVEYINSKKEAVKLIAKNLAEKKLLNDRIVNYLGGLAIGFRDRKLLNELLNLSELNFKDKIFFNLKNIVFPLWEIYKKTSLT